MHVFSLLTKKFTLPRKSNQKKNAISHFCHNSSVHIILNSNIDTFLYLFIVIVGRGCASECVYLYNLMQKAHCEQEIAK